MTDWQKGDLALCVRTGRVAATIAGCIYTVSEVRQQPDGLALDFENAENGAPYGPPRFWGHNPARFRKVTPPKADEFDREVIDLMNRKPVEA